MSETKRWVLAFLITGTVLGLLFLLPGCASEGVSKGAAVQSIGITTAVAAGAATAVTFGWAAVLGFLAGLGRLLFAQSTTTAPPGASDVGIPWGWIAAFVAALLLFYKGDHVLKFLMGTGDRGRFHEILEILIPPLAKAKVAVQAKRAKA